jgi:hypothetical protein
MKWSIEATLGSIAAVAGIVVAWKQFNAPPATIQVNQLPALTMPSLGASSTPTVDSVPEEQYDFVTNNYAGAPLSPITFTAPPTDSTTTTAAYQSSNYGPTHDAVKQQQQAIQLRKQRAQVEKQGGCACNDPCAPYCPSGPVNSQGVPTGAVSYGEYNLSTVSQVPQPAIPSPSLLDSSISQYVATTSVPGFVASYTEQGDTPIAKTPNGVTGRPLAGYGW